MGRDNCSKTVSSREKEEETEIGISWPNDQRQHRGLQVQKDVLPYAL